LINALDSRFNAGGKLTVLARGRALESLKDEQRLQLSGLVSDETAASLGHYLGGLAGITAPLGNRKALAVNEAALEYLNTGKDYLAAGAYDAALLTVLLTVQRLLVSIIPNYFFRGFTASQQSNYFLLTFLQPLLQPFL
jgi:hypothetical protein